MSIQLRLNVAIALLSAAGLFCIVAFILIDAKPRMAAENASTMLLTETLIRSSLAPLRDASDPEQGLLSLVKELKTLRHASVSLASQKQQQSDVNSDGIQSTWLARWKPLPVAPVSVPVEIRGRLVDTIIITPRPGDELSELLEAIFRISEWGSIVAATMLLLTWAIVNQALKPIHALRNAMGRMSAGEFNLRVPEGGPPEIKSICGSLNVLAAALQKAQTDNQRLTSNMILIQDEERRDIARELHDELGPHLFAMRTDASLLDREIGQPKIDIDRAKRLNCQIIGHLDLLQQTNRRVLQRLTPAGLEELGLSGALHAMAAVWRKSPNAIDIGISIDDRVDRLDETRKLTIYRVVQEGLTNAFRHSGASQITVAVTLNKEADPHGSPSPRGSIEVAVSDNGRGRGAEPATGFGLRAMRERVGALSGSLSVVTAATGGTELRVSLPDCDVG